MTTQVARVFSLCLVLGAAQEDTAVRGLFRGTDGGCWGAAR